MSELEDLDRINGRKWAEGILRTCRELTPAYRVGFWLRIKEELTPQGLTMQELDEGCRISILEVQSCGGCNTTQEVNSFGLCQGCRRGLSEFGKEQARRQEANETQTTKAKP